VAVFRGQGEIRLSIKKPFKMVALNTFEVLAEGRRIRGARVLPAEYGLKINGKEFMIYGVKIIPSRDGTITINKRRFRGNVDIIREKDQTLLVVNHIDVEDYLKGVLYHEVSHWWPRAVLRAQAIAARTFALYQAGVNKERDYDLTSDIYSQVYGGATSEKYQTTRAVNHTQGKIMTYSGEILPAFYHATCAGRTEDASVLWKVNLPPLDGVSCGFCGKSPHYNWKHDMRLSELQEVLRKNGFKVGRITSVIVKNRNVSGRALNLVIESTEGNISISAKDFRNMLGPNLLRSNKFDVKVAAGRAHFEGQGWGHGVGMCQWGAYFMSRQRYTAEEILQHYYPGTQIRH